MSEQWIRGRCFRWIAAAAWLFLLGVSIAQDALAAKNVIVCIADGCSAEQYTFARWMKGAPLSFDGLQVGAIRTHIADSVVADSAPAATAFATGVLSSDKHIGVGPGPSVLTGISPPDPGMQYRPVATVLEGAKLLGKSVGVVATSRVSHATPAAFISHTPFRDKETDIMEQAVYQRLDVAFGGGKSWLIPKEAGGKRADGEDLLQVLHHAGVQWVADRQQLAAVRSGRVFGLFADSHLDPDIERSRFHPSQPSLKEMTEKAIEVLSRDPDGFFLMVEGSQIDWACHANDPAYLLSELLAYDAAVEVAVRFAKSHPDTLLLVISDHNTGGFSIGNSASNAMYSQMTREAFLDPFQKMTLTAATMWGQIGENRTPERLAEIIREGWGMDISVEDASSILKLSERYKTAPSSAIGEVLSPKYTYVGWTTHGHCGGDVPLFAYGPGKPHGNLHATEIAGVCVRALGVDLRKLNERLFVDAAQVFDSVRIDTPRTDNPVGVVTWKGRQASFMVNKNLMEIDGKAYPLEGVVVYIPNTGKLYVPLDAVQRLQGKPRRLPAVRL
ncbi:alkaline phosphatase [Desulfatirhabdium butyrativorans]|uniref:alkaline phosphatase n=1 Tax=Desulfatirhabdium butyrativorans TaxID=340467 RepID=UPI0004056E66|nr:alkaline phosphatase [Desulfatirhabdium butyrativorans]